jgi:SOS-response transcriptional repressor LexA
MAPTICGKITRLVNGNLTAPVLLNPRLNYRTMDMSAIFDRIFKRLETVGLTDRQASMLATGKPDLIPNLRKALKTRPGGGFNVQNLMQLAPVLRTNEMWILHGIGSADALQPPPAQGTIYVPQISWVSAGKLIQPEFVSDIDTARHIPAQELDSAGQWIALRVDGDSMDRISPPDSVILVNLADRRLVSNGCYIFTDQDGGATYKRWRPARDGKPAEIAPVSTNPEHKPLRMRPDREPIVIGRVKRTILDL